MKYQNLFFNLFLLTHAHVFYGTKTKTPRFTIKHFECLSSEFKEFTKIESYFKKPVTIIWLDEILWVLHLKFAKRTHPLQEDLPDELAKDSRMLTLFVAHNLRSNPEMKNAAKSRLAARKPCWWPKYVGQGLTAAEAMPTSSLFFKPGRRL